MTHEKWDAPHHKEEKGLMDKKVTFQFSIGAFLKIILVVAVLTGVFLLGRWSVDPVVSNDVAGQAVSLESKSEPGFFSRIFGGSSEGSQSGITVSVVHNDTDSTGLNSSSSANASAVVAVAPVVEAPVVAPVVANSSPVVVANASEETVLTAYPTGTLAFSVVNVQKEWFDTWGKITRLEVSFKNNAEGTVKAKYITINVEGYDYDKKVPLVEEGTVAIKAGQTKSLFVVVPGGFAYNKLTAGDLKSVRIIAILFDEKDVQIATDNKDYDIEGPAPK